MIGPIIIRTRLMKASPSGFIFTASAGFAHPRAMPASVATSTWNQSWVMRRERLGTATVVAVAVIGLPCRASSALRAKSCAEARIHATCVAFEDLRAIYLTQLQGIQIALGVVVVVPRAWIDSADRAHHLGTEQNVLHRHYFQQQLDARKVVHTGIEEHVLQHQLLERWPL